MLPRLPKETRAGIVSELRLMLDKLEREILRAELRNPYMGGN